MKRVYGKEGGPGFIACVIETVKDILTHKDFKGCTVNKPRYFAHLLVIYGFIGAFVTTGFAFLLILLGHEPPIPLTNPVKILGNLSFLALTIGCLILIVRRLADTKGRIGGGGYTNTLFLCVLFTVALTGGGAQFSRLAELKGLAYVFYFIHMTSVYFLLWFAPYSKLAHMFYRPMALVFAKTVNRTSA